MPRFPFLFVPALLVPALLAPAPAARAQAVPPPDAPPAGQPFQRAPEAPVSAFERVGLHGFEVEVGGGVMSGGSDSPVQAPTLFVVNGQDLGGPANGFARGTLLDPNGAAAAGKYFAPYSIDPLAFSTRIGYRLRRYLSLGVFFTFAQYLVQSGADSGDAPDFTGRLARQQASVGLYARYYFTQFNRRLQPWVSLGVGYNYDAASYSRPIGQATGGQPETGDYILQQHGVIVPVGIGLDVRLSPVFTVGPAIGYSRVFPVHGCVEVDLDTQAQPGLTGQNTCNSPPVQNNGYDNLFGGIYAKVTIDPFAR
jgi:hypothetical protein